MTAEARTTTDHDEIRRWAEERGGRPAAVATTHAAADPGILRIDFQEKDEALDEISWEEFFRKFDERRLAFLYQDETKGGATSRFFKLVSRDGGES